MAIKYIFTLIHGIDTDNQVVKERIESTSGVNEFVGGLMTEILENKNYKRFKEDNLNTGVLKEIITYVHDEYISETSHDLVAKKYLKAETKGKESAGRFNKEVRRGYLFQSLFKKEDKFYYVISKVELNEYLGEISMEKEHGMPFADKALKTCLFSFDEDKNLEEIFILDINDSKYWHKDFLELLECDNNESSTKEFYSILKRKVNAKAKSSPADLLDLHSHINYYFKQPRLFTLDDMMDTIFNNYQPYALNKTIINEIKDSVLITAKAKNVDTVFRIVPSAVQKQFKQKININKFVELQVQLENPGYLNMIHSILKDGKKYILIETDNEDTFRKFERSN